MKKTTRLKQLLADKKLLMAPGAYDVLSAKVIEMAGFDAVYMTGYGTSASILGEPDVGLLTMSEMVEHARNIARAVDVPVLADGDTGYGNPLNMRRTVQEYEKAGVCAIQLEDQVFPKRCGHMLGRKVIAMEEMVQKIKAATDARQDKDFVIIARTDARTNYGLEEALRRGRDYREAGADVIFIESPENVEELKAINQALQGTPTLANMIEGGRTPVLQVDELEALGFALAIYPTGPLYAATKAVKDYMAELKAAGTTLGRIDGLAMAAPERHPMLPAIPTAAEAGVPGLELVSWYAVYAPAGTTQDIVDKLAGTMQKIATSEVYRQKILEQGAYATFMGPKELGEFTNTELAYWGEVIEKAGITLE